MTDARDALGQAVFSRRRVLGLGAVSGLAVGLSTVAGCSIGSDAGAQSGAQSGARSGARSGTRTAQSVEVTPDVKTATAALAAIRVARASAQATAQRFPALRPSLSGLIAMHAVHERSLVDAVPDQVKGAAAPTPDVVPPGRAAAMTRLRLTEQRLHATLAGLAVAAQSGDFARLLASMSAAVSTHLATLPSGPR